MQIKHKPYLPFRVTSGYGNRAGANLPKGATTWHDGIDIGRDYKYGGAYSNSPCGPVYAVLDGMVVDSKFYNGRGNTIKIDHGTINGVKVMSLYQHLHASNRAIVGQKVKAGDIIAYMGRTGMGADMMVHLHFELYINGKTVDPMPYLRDGKPIGNATHNTGTQKQEGEMVKQTKINLNGKIKTVNVIEKDGNNYVMLQDLRDSKIAIGYDNKMPTVTAK